MDVDGTLTDGKIYIGPNGEAMKAFNIKDGCGLSQILPKYNIIPIIITARESKILENRCRELNITELHQGSKNKLNTLITILKRYNADLNSVAYIGDDLPDLDVMNAVKNSGGTVLCPADAIEKIKNIADYISPIKAGDGAVRDCIDNYLLRNKEENVLEAKFDTCKSFLKLFEKFKQLINMHNPALSHAPLTSIPFTAYLFSDCIKKDIETILTLKEAENTPNRYAEGIIRNICEQTIEFLYLCKNPSLLGEYYGMQITEEELTILKSNSNPFHVFRRLIGNKKYSSDQHIRDMAVFIGEEVGTDDRMSLYEAYQSISIHNSYIEDFMKLYNAVESLMMGIAPEPDLDFMILINILTKFMCAYRKVIDEDYSEIIEGKNDEGEDEGETDG